MVLATILTSGHVLTKTIKTFQKKANIKGARSGNQRASAYSRFTKGAFNAVPDRYGNLVINTEKVKSGGPGEPDTFQPRGEKGRLQKHVKLDLAEPVNRLNKIATQVVRPLSTLAGLANRANPYLLAADLIQQDIKQSSVNHGTLEGRSDNEMGFQGPPTPKPKAKSKSKPKASFTPPPKKDTAVLAKQDGVTGSLINGLFVAHPWSGEQTLRYGIRGGK